MIISDVESNDVVFACRGEPMSELRKLRNQEYELSLPHFRYYCQNKEVFKYKILDISWTKSGRPKFIKKTFYSKEFDVFLHEMAFEEWCKECSEKRNKLISELGYTKASEVYINGLMEDPEFQSSQKEKYEEVFCEKAGSSSLHSWLSQNSIRVVY